MEHVFLLLAILIVLFWAVGMATGMAAMILLLGLEEKYLVQPTRRLLESARQTVTGLREKSFETAARTRLLVKRTRSRPLFALLRRIPFRTLKVAPE